ncbi:MAG: hypothetical protein ACR2LN_01965 [Candidatus Levyibacteriota bacterium]
MSKVDHESNVDPSCTWLNKPTDRKPARSTVFTIPDLRGEPQQHTSPVPGTDAALRHALTLLGGEIPDPDLTNLIIPPWVRDDADHPDQFRGSSQNVVPDTAQENRGKNKLIRVTNPVFQSPKRP